MSPKLFTILPIFFLSKNLNVIYHIYIFFLYLGMFPIQAGYPGNLEIDSLLRRATNIFEECQARKVEYPKTPSLLLSTVANSFPDRVAIKFSPFC
jgi:hypothetical protein